MVKADVQTMPSPENNWLGIAPECPKCGAYDGDGEPFKSPSGHFLISGLPCPNDDTAPKKK